MSSASFFTSKWYHFSMAAIYIVAGVVLIVKGPSGDTPFRTDVVGWVLCTYGAYRILSRIILAKKSTKTE